MEKSIWKVNMAVALDGEPGAWDCSSFDFLHPQMRIDPFPTFAVMRESSPVHWDGRAHWVFRYDDARSVLLGDEFGRVASAFQEQYFESLGAGQPYEYVIKRMTYLDRGDINEYADYLRKRSHREELNRCARSSWISSTGY